MRVSKKPVWYHGSPYRLTRLFVGSTITQDRRLAEVFSHKPSIVSVENDGRIRHNGNLPGYLYMISKPVNLDELEPVPHSTMEPGKEFLTKCEFSIRLISHVEINQKELLLPEEIHELMQKRSNQ